MNELQIFNYHNKVVRTHIDADKNPWWVAKDVCAILGIAKYRDAASRLDDDESMPLSVDASTKMLTCVSESGLYSLIFRSQKAEAKAFRKWVTSVVLPEIRKNGFYSTGPSWNQARVEGKGVRRITTDIMANFIEYAKAQGSQSAEKYYMIFSKMVNAELLELDGAKIKNLRDHFNIYQLHTFSVADQIISKELISCTAKGLPYKDVYQITKQKIQTYSSAVGRTKIGLTERQMMGLIA